MDALNQNNNQILSLMNNLKPKTFDEKLVFQSVNPLSTNQDRTANKVGLVILSIVFTIITAGLGAILVKKISDSFTKYKNAINKKIWDCGQKVFQKDGTQYLNHKNMHRPELLLHLASWVNTGTHDKNNRRMARNFILKCYNQNENSLELRNLNLSNLPSLILLNNHLKNIILNGNQLRTFPSQLTSLTKLETLKIESNQITQIPNEISNLINLKTLFIGNNNIHQIPDTIFNLPNLKVMYVRGLPLSPRQVESLAIRQAIRTTNNIPSIDIRELPLTRVRPNIRNALRNPAEVYYTWKNLLADNQNKPLANLETLKQMEGSKDLFTFLARLWETKELKYGSQESRKNTAVMVFNILKGMTESEEFAALVIADCHSALNHCGDRIASGFRDIKVNWLLKFGIINNSPMELVLLAVRLRRLNLIPELVIKEKFRDPLELQLYLEVKLGKRLGLPLVPESMLYEAYVERNCTKSQISRFETEILNQTNSKQAIIEILKRQKFWTEHLRQQDHYHEIAERVMESKHQDGTALNEVEKELLMNQEIDKQYQIDTEKWYEANKDALNLALRPVA